MRGIVLGARAAPVHRQARRIGARGAGLAAAVNAWSIRGSSGCVQGSERV